MALSEFGLWTGSPVQIKGLGPGYIAKITRGRRPYHVQTLAGKRYVCSFDHLEEIVSDETKTKAGEAYAKSLLEEADAAGELVLGAMCTLDGRDSTYVVISVVKNGKVKVAQLGGDDNRYVNAPVGMVTKINSSAVRAFVDGGSR